MTDLDDAVALRAADPGGMLDLVLGLPEHCREGYALGLAAPDLPSVDDVRAVAFCGMGGSAVAGDVIRALYTGRLGVPVTVVRSPELPTFCGPHALVLVSSYSGSTEETLACFDEAVDRGCRVIVVTSGGELAHRSAELGLGRVLVPGGFMPRAALGYLALGALGALEVIGLIPPLARDLEEAVLAMDAIVAGGGPEIPTEVNAAKSTAARIGSRFPIVWGADGVGAVAALRWKTQFNENAKVPAFASALPELDHNEVVGWSEGQGDRFFLIALRSSGEQPTVVARFALSMEIARFSGTGTAEVHAADGTLLTQLLSLVLQGDLTTTYLGLARGVDPTPIEAIARLKRALAEA